MDTCEPGLFWLFELFGRLRAPEHEQSGESQVVSAFATVAAFFDVISHLLVVGEPRHSRALQRRDVDEDVLAARFRCDEAEAFWGVEPFHCAIGHIRGLLFLGAARNTPQPGNFSLGRSTESRVNGGRGSKKNNDSPVRMIVIARCRMGLAEISFRHTLRHMSDDD